MLVGIVLFVLVLGVVVAVSKKKQAPIVEDEQPRTQGIRLTPEETEALAKAMTADPDAKPTLTPVQQRDLIRAMTAKEQ